MIGSTNFTGNTNIARVAPNGGEVSMGITNNGNSAYSALYLQTRNQSGSSTNETGQLFVGASGFVMQSRTNHPIYLKAYSDEPLVNVPNSLTISNNATRDVIISTPLIVNNNVTVNGSLTTTKGPWFCAGRVNTATGAILSNYGRVSFTVLVNAQASVTITMLSAHPQGANYVCTASSGRAFTTIENNSTGLGVRTSTSFQIVLRNSDFITLANDTNGLTFAIF